MFFQLALELVLRGQPIEEVVDLFTFNYGLDVVEATDLELYLYDSTRDPQ